MTLGSFNFCNYERNLRRVMWAEFLDEQLRIARVNQFRATIVQNPYAEQQTLIALMQQTRNDQR